MVKIDDTYYMNADSNCYMLCTKANYLDKEGNVVYINEGYYTTLESLLNAILKKELRKFISKKDMNSIKDLKEEVIKQTEYVKSLKLNF